MLNDLYHLGGKFLVSLKFVGAFVEVPLQGFVEEEVYVRGKRELLCYKHFPLKRFFPFPKKALLSFERRVEEEYKGKYVKVEEKLPYLSAWVELVEETTFVGVGNYVKVEEAVRKTELLVVYRWNGRELVLGKDSFKPIPDRRAISYLLPLGCFPETITKLGRSYGV